MQPLGGTNGNVWAYVNLAVGKQPSLDWRLRTSPEAQSVCSEELGLRGGPGMTVPDPSFCDGLRNT
jgi:hypothetical protein